MPLWTETRSEWWLYDQKLLGLMIQTAPHHSLNYAMRLELLLPKLLSKGSQLRVDNVGRHMHDGIDNQRSESLELFLALIDAISKVSIGWFH
jgi:hypothetical protein